MSNFQKIRAEQITENVFKMIGREWMLLTAVAGNTGAVYFKEARLVFECKKIYAEDITPAKFIEKELINSYPDKDYHRMYIGEIIECLQKSK